MAQSRNHRDLASWGGVVRSRRRSLTPTDRFGSLLEHAVLPREEQIALVRASHEAQARAWEGWADSDPARHRLAASSARLVVWEAARVARRFGLPIDETASDGFVGLMQSIDTFDPGRGAAFATYATFGVRLRVLRKAPTRPAPVSLDAPAYPGGPSLAASTPARTGSEEPTVDEATEHEQLTGAAAATLAPLLGLLDDRERRVVASRYGLDGHAVRTLEALGAELGVSKERARQIEARALMKMRKRAGVVAAPAEAPPGDGLTPREARVLAVLRSLPGDRPISFGDVARRAGLPLKRDAMDVARRLRSRGLIDWAPTEARGGDAA